MRQYRKQEHIENYLKCTYQGETLLGDVFIEHNALPGMALRDVDMCVEFLGKKSDYPIFINAMTGGSNFSLTTNEKLAQMAQHFNIPMAVGSQTLGLQDPGTTESFSVVREHHPDGIILANLNGNASIDDAKRAVDMVKADALQIHLNPAQELSMAEGDRDFTHIAHHIETIVSALSVPVIVKEVGFGISKETARRLYDLGVRYIDISGHGGSNFIEIENLRNPRVDLTELYCWGIPTAYSLIQCRSIPKDDLHIIASGGVKTSLDVLKCLVIGADMVGISGEILTYLVHGGYDHSIDYIQQVVDQLRMLLLLTGARNVADVKHTPYKVMGRLFELLHQPNQ